MAYIEEQLAALNKNFNDFRVEMADRLGRIETSQSNIDTQLSRMNGSVAAGEARVRVLETEKATAGEKLAEALERIDAHESEIKSLKHDAIYDKGRTAGISIAASAVTSLLYGLAQWFFHRH